MNAVYDVSLTDLTAKRKGVGKVDKISEQDYEQIAATINSDASPVGIDAKKTHVLILHLLDKIEKRLERLEARFDKLDSL